MLTFYASTAMTLAQQRIAETVDHFYEQGAPLGYAGQQYKLAVQKIDDDAKTELVREFFRSLCTFGEAKKIISGHELPRYGFGSARKARCRFSRIQRNYQAETEKVA